MEEQLMQLDWWVYALYFIIGFSASLIWNAYDFIILGLKPVDGFWGTLFVAIVLGFLWLPIVVAILIIYLFIDIIFMRFVP